MSGSRSAATCMGVVVWLVGACAEPVTTPAADPVLHVDPAPAIAQDAMQGTTAPDAHTLLLQQMAFFNAGAGAQTTAPTCTILRAFSPSLNFDRSTRIGNCSACVPGSPVLAVATAGVGAAGNASVATARCGGADVAGPTRAVDPGRGGVELNASAGLQTAGVPTCAVTYTGGVPHSNRSFTCIFF